MNASLGRMAEAIRICYENFDFGIVRSQGTDAVYEDFSRGVHSLVEQFKEVEDEYYTLPKDDEEEIVSKSKVVGLRDQRRKLKDDVIDPLHKSTIYSVIGMAGIGKTTLAREVFEDLDISNCYDCRAWVTVGNERKLEEITESILSQVDPEVHKMIMDGCKEDIGEVLKESLKGRRYLVVLDDIWYLDVNEYMESSFPDNQNGSRVLLTTRIKYVGIELSEGNIIDMRLLDKEESWDLLREKVLAADSCPRHLQDALKEIAKKCDGLPLTIVTVADLLSKAEIPRDSLWIDVATKRKHQLFIDAYDQISKVLYPSYNMLDDISKMGFLYMGAFPPKYEISKSRLINLWIAEKFFKPRTNNTLEACAIDILKCLDLNGIIMVYQRSSIRYPTEWYPSVKTCGLHSVWSYFCQIEARETYTFYVIDCYDKDNLEEGLKDQCVLSIHNNVLFALKDVYNSIEKICTHCALSLLCFGPYSQYMVPVCFGLKFLRRLDALNIRFYNFPLEVVELVKLRYLALTSNGKVPPSISNLQKLQYLIVRPHLSIKSSGTLSDLPLEVWDMKRLKHLQVMGYDLPYHDDTSLEELITLLGVTTASCIVLHRVPNLTKLGIRIELAPDAAEPSCCFDHVSRLTKLESLKCVIVNPTCNPVSPFPCLPISLIKLSLSGMGYPWEEMSNIVSLPNLKVLKLRCNAFRGPKWEVEENGFPKLDSLLIEDMDLVKLKWAYGSFDGLEFLRIKHCYKLEELHLGNLPSMSEIEVVDCGPLVEWYVKHGALDDFVVGEIIVRSSWKNNERQSDLKDGGEIELVPITWH